MSYNLDWVSFFFKLAFGHEIDTKKKKLLKRQMRQEFTSIKKKNEGKRRKSCTASVT